MLTSHGAGDEEYPTWSPDGSSIAYSTDEDGDYEIVMTTLSLPSLTQLTTNATMDFQPDWQPV